MSARTRAWEQAAGSLGIDPGRRLPRPNPFRWLWYAFWGPLPGRFATWVLYDATCSTWVLRHVSRLLTILALPVAVTVLFLPGPISVRVLTAGAAAAGSFLFTAVWVNEATEHRLLQAGWRPSLGYELRKRRSEMWEWMSAVRRL